MRRWKWPKKDPFVKMRQGYCCFGDVKKMLWAATEWRVQGQYTEVGKQANANYHCTTGTSERTKRWWRWNGPIRCFLETLLIGIGYVPFSHTYVGEPQLYLYHLYPSFTLSNTDWWLTDDWCWLMMIDADWCWLMLIGDSERCQRVIKSECTHVPWNIVHFYIPGVWIPSLI